MLGENTFYYTKPSYSPQLVHRNHAPALGPDPVVRSVNLMDSVDPVVRSVKVSLASWTWRRGLKRGLTTLKNPWRFII